MKRRLGIAGLLLVTGLVSAQAADAPGLDELRLRVMSFVHGKTVAAAREQAILLFRTLDIDGVPGISQADYDLAARIQWAQQRSYQIAAILAYDLDGDGQVTRAELQLAFGRQARAPIQQSGVALMPTGEQMKAVLDKLVETALEADANKDGIITFQEMLAHVDGKFKTQMANRHQDQVVPLALDRNGDGVVSLAEYTAALDIVLKEVDSDGDGQISAAEVQAYQQTLQSIQRAVSERAEQERQRAQIAAKVKTCGLPAVPAGAFVAVVSTFEGAAISNVAIGDDAQEIRAAQIDIQEGQQPIYVVATSQTGMIWQFTGATHRVAHFVSMANGVQGPPRIGVIGIDKQKVTTRPANDCFGPFHDDGDLEKAKVAAGAFLAGRAPDIIVVKSKLSRVRLPLGQASSDHPYEKAMPGPLSYEARELHKEVLRHAPQGVAMFDPATVVATAPAKLFDVLPGQAGLVQLIEKGLIEVTGYTRQVDLGGMVIIGNANVVGGDNQQIRVSQVPSAFRIFGELTLPAGLDGAHRLRFVVAKGVPMPKGDTRHAQVTCEGSKTGLKPGEICE